MRRSLLIGGIVLVLTAGVFAQINHQFETGKAAEIEAARKNESKVQARLDVLEHQVAYLQTVTKLTNQNLARIRVEVAKRPRVIVERHHRVVEAPANQPLTNQPLSNRALDDGDGI